MARFGENLVVVSRNRDDYDTDVAELTPPYRASDRHQD